MNAQCRLVPYGTSHLDAPTITSSMGSMVAGWEEACAVYWCSKAGVQRWVTRR